MRLSNIVAFLVIPFLMIRNGGLFNDIYAKNFFFLNGIYTKNFTVLKN